MIIHHIYILERPLRGRLTVYIRNPIYMPKSRKTLYIYPHMYIVYITIYFKYAYPRFHPYTIVYPIHLNIFLLPVGEKLCLMTFFISTHRELSKTVKINFLRCLREKLQLFEDREITELLYRVATKSQKVCIFKIYRYIHTIYTTPYIYQNRAKPRIYTPICIHIYYIHIYTARIREIQNVSRSVV